MENPPFIDDFPIQTSIYKSFPHIFPAIHHYKTSINLPIFHHLPPSHHIPPHPTTSWKPCAMAARILAMPTPARRLASASASEALIFSSFSASPRSKAAWQKPRPWDEAKVGQRQNWGLMAVWSRTHTVGERDIYIYIYMSVRYYIYIYVYAYIYILYNYIYIYIYMYHVKINVPDVLDRFKTICCQSNWSTSLGFA